MRFAVALLVIALINSYAWTQAGQPEKKEVHVLLTDRKSWLGSGAFASRDTPVKKAQFDHSKDFHKQCPKAVLTASKDESDYAVTIDSLAGEFGRLGAWDIAVYSHTGLVYMGQTLALKNAIKDACGAIGAN